MADNQEPAETEIAADDVGSTNGSREKPSDDAPQDEKVINTSMSEKTVTVPGSSSTSLSLSQGDDDDEFIKQRPPVDNTFVDEIERMSDEEGHMLSSTDIDFSGEQDTDDDAVESEYDEEEADVKEQVNEDENDSHSTNHEESKPRDIIQANGGSDDAENDSAQGIGLEPHLPTVSQGPQHLLGMNQPSALVDEDGDSLGSNDLFDPPKRGLATSKPLVAAARKAKEQTDRREREAKSKHLEGMNQPTTVGEDEDSLGSADLFDPPKRELTTSKPLVAAARKAKEQADQREREARSKHLEGLNQPTAIEEDGDSLEFGELFDPPERGLPTSKPLLAAALKAKEQAERIERESRAKHLQGMNQPATIFEEDEDSLGSGDLFDPPKRALATSKPLVAAAKRAPEQTNLRERKRGESNHAESQNGNQEKDNQGGLLEVNNDTGSDHVSTLGPAEKSVDIELDDIIPNSSGKGEANDDTDTKTVAAGAHGEGEEEGDRDSSHIKHAGSPESSLVQNDSKERSASSTNDDSSSWRSVVIGLTVCFFFIIASQGITIGILSSGDNDNNANITDRGIGSGANGTPTATPSSGTSTGFRSIANEPGAVRLDLVSDCSDICTESFPIPAAFDLRWSMSDFLRLISVSSNGNIILTCEFYSTCGIIETLGDNLGLGVDTSIQGDIFVLPKVQSGGDGALLQAENMQTTSLTVSWENIQLSSDFPAGEEYQVNLQVTISERKIDLCYGEGNTHGAILVASFQNFTEGTSHYPDGYPFAPEGFADRFPSNRCFAFESTLYGLDDDLWTFSPTPSFTWLPGDTLYPSTMGPTNPSFSGFVPLASIEEATPLRLVSNCDDCYESVQLETAYLWDGKYAVSSLLVSSNGHLELVGRDGTEYVRINVVSMDLDTSRDDGINVRYFRREPSGVTFVSWENMQLYGTSRTDTSRLNGQVLIHPEGRIDICWGEIFLENELLQFESRIYGYVDGSNYFATGPSFDSFGNSNGETLSSNTCQTLVGNSKQTVSALYANEFTYLSTIQGATKLETASAFDDNVEIIELDTPIRWIQDTFTDRLAVTSNGEIRVDGCPFESFDCGQIAVAAADLDPATNGNVWFLDTTKLEGEPGSLDPTILYVISWEDVSMFSLPLTRINAQALFYDDGTIEICFGAAESFEVTVFAGVFDPRFDVDDPAWGEGIFSFGGFTEIGVWPTGLCQSFYAATNSTLPRPSMPPASSKTPSPSKAPGFAPNCEPTSGACVSTESDLARELKEAREGNIVALCGDMRIMRTISVEKSNVTLCCARESSGCLLESASETQIMSISGSSFTLTGFKLQNGVSNRNGGNLAIDASGHHSIRNCIFSAGRTSFMYGGNVFVANADSISISDSMFNAGTAPLGGSGVAFESTGIIDIRHSKFQNNFGEGAGGGVLVFQDLDAPPRDTMTQLYIENSVFEENSAEVGAGLAVQDVDAINMTVLGSVFEFNMASVVGGALSVTGANSTIATLQGNSGEGNSDAGSSCAGFFFDENMDYEGGLCYDTRDFVQLSNDDFPQDQTETPSRGADDIPICTRTFPTCAETEDDIKSMLLDAKPDDVISLCGGMVSVSETIQVSQLNVALCCEAYPSCTLSSINLSGPIMSVDQGGNFTAIGIRFENGVNGGNGGNLVIDAPGYHSIQFCEFFSGYSEANGGSLYVGNADSVTVAHSHFNSGTAIGGGAAAFVDTKVVSIEASAIVDNTAGSEGGGLLFLSNDENSSMSVSITGTTFEGNSAAEGGGGFAVRGFGSVQFLLSDSWFYDNSASVEGASGKIFVSGLLDSNFEGNNGEFSVDPTGGCEWIFVENASSGISGLCFDLNFE